MFFLFWRHLVRKSCIWMDGTTAHAFSLHFLVFGLKEHKPGVALPPSIKPLAPP
jgi:hypothetical protein